MAEKVAVIAMGTNDGNTATSYANTRSNITNTIQYAIDNGATQVVVIPPNYKYAYNSAAAIDAANFFSSPGGQTVSIVPSEQLQWINSDPDHLNLSTVKNLASQYSGATYYGDSNAKLFSDEGGISTSQVFGYPGKQTDYINQQLFNTPPPSTDTTTDANGNSIGNNDNGTSPSPNGTNPSSVQNASQSQINSSAYLPNSTNLAAINNEIGTDQSLINADALAQQAQLQQTQPGGITRQSNYNQVTIVPDLADINITFNLARLQNSTTFFETLPAANQATPVVSLPEVQCAIDFRNCFKGPVTVTDYANFWQTIESKYFSQLHEDPTRTGGFPNDSVLHWVEKYYQLPELSQYASYRGLVTKQLFNATNYNLLHTSFVNSIYKSDTASFIHCLSDSIGLLANSKYHQLDSTQPIFDITQQTYGVPIPFTANMENKVGPTARNLAYNLSLRTTALMRANLQGIAYYDPNRGGNYEIDSSSPHGQNLVNDIGFFVKFSKAVASRVNVVKSAFDGSNPTKLFTFIQYISNIGNKCALNLRDVYQPIHGYDHDFTYAPNTTDLAVNNLDAGKIDQQVATINAYNTIDALTVSKLYYAEANQTYYGTPAAVYSGSTQSLLNSVVNPQAGAGPTAPATQFTVIDGSTSDFKSIVDQANAKGLVNIGTSFGNASIDSNTASEIVGKTPAEALAYQTSAAAGQYSVGNSFAANPNATDAYGNKIQSGQYYYFVDSKTGQLITSDTYNSGSTVYNASGVYQANGTGPAASNRYDVYFGDDQNAYNAFSNAYGSGAKSGIVAIPVNGAVQAQTVSTTPGPGTDVMTTGDGVPVNNVEQATVVAKPLTPAAGAGVTQTVPQPTPTSTAAAAALSQASSTTPAAAATAASIAGQDSARVYSNTQRAIPFSFKIRVEDINGERNDIDVDYLLKKIIFNNVNATRSIHTLTTYTGLQAIASNQGNYGASAGAPPSATPQGSALQNLIKSGALNSFLGLSQNNLFSAGSVTALLQQAGLNLNSTGYSQLANSALRILDAKNLTTNNLSQLASSLIGVAANRLPVNVLQSFSAGTAAYDKIVGSLNIPGISSSEIIQALNPVNLLGITVDIKGILPSAGLGSITQLLQLVAQTAAAGPPTIFTAFGELTSIIKSLNAIRCNFELPFFNWDQIQAAWKALTTRPFSLKDIETAIANRIKKIVDRIGDLLDPDKIYQSVKTAVKSYLLSLYTQLFTCTNINKNDKSGKFKLADSPNQFVQIGETDPFKLLNK